MRLYLTGSELKPRLLFSENGVLVQAEKASARIIYAAGRSARRLPSVLCWS